jgi:hypothetical protein
MQSNFGSKSAQAIPIEDNSQYGVTGADAPTVG